MIKLALLGAGRIGQVHAKAIDSQSHAKLVAVSDVFATAAQHIATQYGCEILDIEQILNSDEIDGVIICTPTNTHADLIEQFTLKNKAIFCEKPIDLNLTRAKKCVDIVAENNGHLMLGFNRRFDPHFMALKSTITNGHIGDVEQVVITSRDPGLPPLDYIKNSGGIFKDMTIHDFDMARFLLGQEVENVYATASILIDQDIAQYSDYDTAMVVLTTKSGQQCVINNSRRASYGYDQRIEIHGSKGMASAKNQRPVSVEIANSNGFTKPPLHDFFMTRYTEAYATEIASFVDCISQNNAPSPSGVDGVTALAMAEAALLSVSEKRVVKMSELI